VILGLEAWLQRWRREIALASCLALAATIVFVSELGHDELTQRYQSAVDSIATGARLHTLSARLADAESGLRSFLLTGRRDYLQPYRDTVPEIRMLLDRLRPYYAVHPDVDAEKVFAALIAAVSAKLGEIESNLEWIDHARLDRALAVGEAGLGQRTTEEIRFLLEDLSQREEAWARHIAGGWRVRLSLSRQGIALVAALNAVLVIALFFGLKRDWRVASERQTVLDGRVRSRTRELDSFAARLQEAIEAERSALARELHDEMGSLLTAAKMDIAWARGRLGDEQAVVDEKLARTCQHLDHCIVAKRRIVEGLRPSTLSTFGLATAARELAEQVAERAGWSLQLELPPVDPKLPEDVEIALFRLLQESLTNAAKHAQAKGVHVRLECDARRCSIEVEDDGQGFRARDIAHDAQGLLGMRQRTQVRGGKLDIRTPCRGPASSAVLVRARIGRGRAVLERCPRHRRCLTRPLARMHPDAQPVSRGSSAAGNRVTRLHAALYVLRGVLHFLPAALEIATGALDRVASCKHGADCHDHRQ
jgi:signal transduction histidine kinase